MDIRHCVIPAAGLGTRFLPATKALPKELLPVLDRPVLQWGVEEAVAAGLDTMVVVLSRGKELLAAHFDSAPELERKGKDVLLDQVRSVLPEGVKCIYIRQPEPLGLGHAVLCAQPVVGDSPFAVILADDLIDANPPAMARMAQAFERDGSSLLGVEEVPREQTQSYGIVTVDRMEGDLARIHSIVEKPKPADAPSNLGVIGRYVLTPRIFELLAQVVPGTGGEIQLTDAISALLTHERVLAVRLPGRRFDCGSKLGYLKATIELGLRHPEVGGDFARFLKSR